MMVVIVGFGIRMALAYFLVFFVLSHLVVLLQSAEEQKIYNRSCPPFQCGKLGEIRYPFTNISQPECGSCMIDCSKQKIKLGKGGHWYAVTNISQAKTIAIDDRDLKNLLQSHNCSVLNNLTCSNSTSISFKINPANITLYKCPRHPDLTPQTDKLFNGYYNYTGCDDYNIYYSHHVDNHSTPQSLPHQCSVILLPISLRSPDLFNLLTAQFSLELMVDSSRGGQCQYDSKGNYHCAKLNGTETGREGKFFSHF
uniref:Wall-associated receptor kinase galacturonan-binding domain-containing protein n=1 Tax=Davidia involucrata TaxID=16924 RepID=A0A5B6ZI06_DAVIN